MLKALKTIIFAPLRWFGATVSAAIVLGVSVNALFLQDQRHPAPLAGLSVPATQDQAAGQPIPMPTAAPATQRPVSTETFVVTPNSTTDGIARLLTTAEPSALPGAQRETEEARKLVRAIQTGLASKGLYDGDVDGLTGPRTRAAIEAFERAIGAEVTAEPSVRILKEIQLYAGGSPASTPAAPVTTAALPAPRPRVAAAPTTETSSVDQPAATGNDRVRAVQQILAEYGYAPGPVDGLMGEATRSAIKRFQAHYRLPQTGDLTPDLIRVMEEVTGRPVV